jgi:hypothetical protein
MRPGSAPSTVVDAGFDPAISPDGRILTYTTGDVADQDLWYRPRFRRQVRACRSSSGRDTQRHSASRRTGDSPPSWPATGQPERSISTSAAFPAARTVRRSRQAASATGRASPFHRNGPQLVAASCSTSGAFAVTSRQVLFSGNFDRHPFHPNYDVAPDGRRFAMISSGDAEPQVVVVTNWIEELRQQLGKR